MMEKGLFHDLYDRLRLVNFRSYSPDKLSGFLHGYLTVYRMVRIYPWLEADFGVPYDIHERAKEIARWYEVYGYDDAMVQEAAVQAGPKRDLWYWNSILKTWNAKGLRNIHDVRTPVAAAGASRNIRVDRETPSGNDFLKNAARRRPLKKKSE